MGRERSEHLRKRMPPEMALARALALSAASRALAKELRRAGYEQLALSFCQALPTHPEMVTAVKQDT